LHGKNVFRFLWEDLFIIGFLIIYVWVSFPVVWKECLWRILREVNDNPLMSEDELYGVLVRVCARAR
jgi:hypothetical protein